MFHIPISLIYNQGHTLMSDSVIKQHMKYDLHNVKHSLVLALKQACWELPEASLQKMQLQQNPTKIWPRHIYQYTLDHKEVPSTPNSSWAFKVHTFSPRANWLEGKEWYNILYLLHSACCNHKSEHIFCVQSSESQSSSPPPSQARLQYPVLTPQELLWA